MALTLSEAAVRPQICAHILGIANKLKTLSEAAVRPQICAHIPGIANKLADLLSRKFQPGEIFSVPAVLRHVPEEPLLPRTRDWFQTLARQAAASSR